MIEIRLFLLRMNFVWRVQHQNREIRVQNAHMDRMCAHGVLCSFHFSFFFYSSCVPVTVKETGSDVMKKKIARKIFQNAGK